MVAFKKAVISWSHADPDWAPAQAKQRADDVHHLANVLRANGIDVAVDLHQVGGVSWPRFGAALIAEPDRAVIIVASKAWRTAWEGTGDPSKGAGAAGETDALYSVYVENRERFVERTFLVVLPGTEGDVLPRALHVSRFELASLDEAGIEPLLRALLAQPYYKAAPLGLAPEFRAAPDAAPATDAPMSLATGTHGHRFRPLAAEPQVRWLMSHDHWSGPSGATLVVHIAGNPPRRLTRRELVAAADEFPGILRRHRLVPDAAPINPVLTDGGVAVVVSEDRYSRNIELSKLIHIALFASGQVSVTHTLPRDSMGAVVDAGALECDLGASLRIASYVLATKRSYAVAIEIGPTTTITSGTVAELGRNSVSLPHAHRGSFQLDPDEAVDSTDLARDAAAIATDLLPAIMRAWDRF